jgi:plastocyanin
MKKNFKKTRISLTNVIAVLFILSMLSGCSKGDTSAVQGANEVWIQSKAFSPSVLKVTVNTTVKWTNKDTVPHTVTSASTNDNFDSGTINPNGTFDHAFTSVGTYPYYCTFHPKLTGSIVVE